MIRRLITIAFCTLLTACSNGAQSTQSPSAATSVEATASATASPSENLTGEPTLRDSFEVDDNGRRLAVTCWGDGSPTIILEGGHPASGLGQFGVYGHALVGELAIHTRTCAYDRAGYGDSDPAPNEPRDLDDVTDDLHALLEAAAIEEPYILVGASFGGFIVTYYAHRFPRGVDGVVTLDVPAPSAELTLEDIPELAWDHPQNPEHVDVIPEFEGRLAREQFVFEAPLVVITATDGQSDVADQAFWLDWSAESRQVEIEGGHDVYQDSPDEVADEILSLIK